MQYNMFQKLVASTRDAITRSMLDDAGMSTAEYSIVVFCTLGRLPCK